MKPPIQIESGVPLPEPRNPWLSIFLDMKVGQSFLVVGKDVNRVRCALSQSKKREVVAGGMSYTCRKVNSNPPEFRLWRTK